ncbi:MAG: hypothetical protein WA397_15415 [Roseiarcus sp.]
MKPRRSALPLPRYVGRKPLRNGAWAHFFNPPTWARRAGCPVASEALGVDYDAAVKRAENVLLPAFDSWRSGGASDKVESLAKAGTLDWVFAEYRTDRRFTKLDAGTRRVHETGFRLVGQHELKDGRRLEQASLSAITTAVADTLYEKLLIVRETDGAGNVIERERRTTVNHAMKTCRRAWNVVFRRHPTKVPHVNPFASMGLTSSSRETPTATFEEFQIFRAKAKEMGLHSLATAALIAWEFLQRQTDIFGVFSVAHYRPKEQPNAVHVVHEKTREENWVPLIDEKGVPLYPELMAELDAIKRERIGGLMLRRDWGDRGPWPTWPTPDDVDLTHMSRKVKEVIRAAGLRDELSFASFRHGGFTEAGDAELTDRHIMAQGRHKSPKVLGKYVKVTMRQVAKGAQKRRLERTNGDHLSE